MRAGAAVEICERINNFTTHIILDVITNAC